MTFDLADIQHISVPACCDMTTPDLQSDLELATCHAGCNLAGDVGGLPIAEGLAQGEGSRQARHDSVTLSGPQARCWHATNDTAEA